MITISQEMKKKVFEFSLAVYRVTNLFPMGEVLKRQTREIANELLREISELETKEGFDIGIIKRIVGKMLVLKNFLLLAKYNNFVRPLNVDVLLKELSFFESFFLRQLQYQNDPFWHENEMVDKKNNFSAGEPKKEVIKEKLDKKVTTPELVYATVREKIQDSVYVSGQKIPSFEKKQEESLRKVFGQKTEEGVAGMDGNDYSERQRAILDYLRAKKMAKANDLAVIFSNRFSLKTLQRDLAGLIEGKVIERRGDKRWAVYMMRGGEIGANAVS